MWPTYLMADITLQEAARLLDRSTPIVLRWVQQGILEATKVEGVYFLDYNDVVAAKEALENGLIHSKKPRYAEIELRLTRLEQLVRDLVAAAGMPMASGFHHLPDHAIYMMYDSVGSTLDADSWSELETKKWANIFLKITEVDFQRLSSLSNQPHPWKPFLQLANEMQAQWGAAETSFETAEICFTLKRGLQNLRRSAMLYISLGDTTPEAEVDRFLSQAPVTRLTRRFLKRGKKQ